MVWLWLQIKNRLVANTSNKEIKGGICSNLACLVRVGSISNIANR